MTILIHAIKSTGESKLIAVAPLHLRDKVEEYCAKRNADSIEAGYNTSYKYEITDAVIIEDELDLLYGRPRDPVVTDAAQKIGVHPDNAGNLSHLNGLSF